MFSWIHLILPQLYLMHKLSILKGLGEEMIFFFKSICYKRHKLKWKWNKLFLSDHLKTEMWRMRMRMGQIGIEDDRCRDGISWGENFIWLPKSLPAQTNRKVWMETIQLDQLKFVINIHIHHFKNCVYLELFTVLGFIPSPHLNNCIFLFKGSGGLFFIVQSYLTTQTG